MGPFSARATASDRGSIVAALVLFIAGCQFSLLAQEPAATEPAATEPAAAEPAATATAATEPVATEPVATEPVATEPVATEPVAPPQTTTIPASLLPEPLHDLPSRETKAAGFQGLIPGSSTTDDILAKLGEPKQRTGDRRSTTLVYQVGPFSRVELDLRDEQLQSINAQFTEPRPIQEIAQELKLTKYAAVPEYTSDGRARAIVFPERGMRIGVHPQEQNLGTHVFLGMPTAADFYLRAQADRSSLLQQQLADVREALAIDPQYEPAIAMQVRLWDESGFPELALERAQSAQQQQPSSTLLQLELARLQLRHAQYEAALQQVSDLLARPNLPALSQASARLLRADCAVSRGQLKASDPRPMVEELMQAIRAAAPLMKEGSPGERKQARWLILQAHLTAARLISASEWNNRSETVTKWLANAQAIADSHVQVDQASPDVMLLVWCAALECHLQLRGELDPQPLAQRMISYVDARLAANSDTLFQRRTRTCYAAALLAAARTQQFRGDVQAAEAYAQRAADVAGEVARRQPPHREAELLLGQSLFTIGAIYGIGSDDHETAVSWYDRAEPLLCAPIPAWCYQQRNTIGDQLVSMGLSNWSVEEKQRGIELTQKGLELLQAADKDGDTRRESLSVAFSNLAFMHAAVGNKEQARELQELARKLEK